MIRPYQAKNNSYVIYHITQDVPGYYNLSDNKQVIVHIAKLGSLFVKLKTTLVERKKTCFKVEYLLFLWHTSLEVHWRILTFLKCWMILCYKLKTVHVALKSSHVWLLSVVSGDKTINLWSYDPVEVASILLEGKVRLSYSLLTQPSGNDAIMGYKP